MLSTLKAEFPIERTKKENQEKWNINYSDIFDAIVNEFMPKIKQKTQIKNINGENLPGGKAYNFGNEFWSQFFLTNQEAFKVPLTTTQINFGLSFLNLVVGVAITCSLAGAPIGIPMVVNSIISLGEIAAGCIAGSMILTGAANTVAAGSKLVGITLIADSSAQRLITASNSKIVKHSPTQKISISSGIKIAIGLGMIGVGIAACSTGIGAIGGIPLLIAGMMMVSGMALTIPSFFRARASFFKRIDTPQNLKENPDETMELGDDESRYSFEENPHNRQSTESNLEETNNLNYRDKSLGSIEDLLPRLSS